MARDDGRGADGGAAAAGDACAGAASRRPRPAVGSAAIGADSEGQFPEWADLPGSVRTAAIGVAARALGVVPTDQLPSALLPVARFTPAKRARLGAGLLARALEHDGAFRALAAQHAPPAGTAPDPAAAAARAFLLRLPECTELVALAARADELGVLRARAAELTATVEILTARLAATTAPMSVSTAARSPVATASTPHDKPELERLRHRLRDQGTRVKAAERAAEASIARALAERDEALAEGVRQRTSAENWRARAEKETQRADAARHALDRLHELAGEERANTDRRIVLLLDTVEQAAAGLRREWRLATGGAVPADLVARRLPAAPAAPSRSADPALLIDWLNLPGAHLIVDGYNVTKTGFGELSLADQRDRLTRSLGALAARTGAEITVVFDGAAVIAAAPSARGVRVMFSPPGVIADDVIRQLAAAEPSGRVVVVVSSDREVVDGVRRSGAYTAPSPVLLTLLG